MQGSSIVSRGGVAGRLADFNAEGRAQLIRVLHAGGYPAVPKQNKPIRVGILGASTVATYALIWPARRLADVEVAAVAARDNARARQYAYKHGIPKAYGSYSELVADPTLDAIYVATPNGLHGEWAAAALDAGKHVLCEKPFTANADEASSLQSQARRAGLLCREAFHYKEHPANAAVAALLQGGAVGRLQQVDVQVLIPSWAFGSGDIRWRPELAGGTMMDAGCYCAHTLRHFPGVTRPRVTSATAPQVMPGGIDVEMQAEVEYPAASGAGGAAAGSPMAGGAKGRLRASLKAPGLWPVTQFRATGDMGTLTMDNFIMPFVGHSITLTQHTDQLVELQQRSSDILDAAAAEVAAAAGAAAGISHGRRTAGMAGSKGRELLPYLPLSSSCLADAGTKVRVPPSGGLLRAARHRGRPSHGDALVTQLQVYGNSESNYYHQLSRFVKDTRLLLGSPGTRLAAQVADAQDALDNMSLLDAIYTAADLPLRLPTQQYMAASKGEGPLSA